MRAVEVIRTKRDGGELSPDQLRAFAHAAATGAWGDDQLAALLMAVFLRGMTPAETASLTRAMTDSGTVYDLSDLPGVKADKHSTGGVGDKVSLILAPLAAAIGVTVPMMSGRGLGHTGGTLDKLEAIPGFRVNLSEGEFRTALKTVGCAMIGQSAAVAPADKKLYALRDVTGTVESIPLITASILSKKLAEGISALVMDVKCGRGAFMKTPAEAKALAESIQRVGTANGLAVRTMISDMDTPLGRQVGNALEVIEAVDTLSGHGPDDLTELCVRQAAMMAEMAGLADGEAKAREALASGAALAKFRRMVEQQGGDPRAVDDPVALLAGTDLAYVRVDRPGYVADIDPYAVGVAAMRLGAGREKLTDAVDHAVGVNILAKRGEWINQNEAVFEVYYREGAERLEGAMGLLRGCYTISEAPPPPVPLILEELQ